MKYDPAKNRIYAARYQAAHPDRVVKKRRRDQLHAKIVRREKSRALYASSAIDAYNRYWRDLEEKKMAAIRRVKAWIAANRARAREMRRAYKAKHRDDVLARAADYRAKNRERLRKQSCEYTAQNAPKRRTATANRRARIRGLGGRGISAVEYREIVNSTGGLCPYCGRRRSLEIDHITPVADGGDHDVENASAACRRCNNSKNNTTLLVWMARRASQARNGECQQVA